MSAHPVRRGVLAGYLAMLLGATLWPTSESVTFLLSDVSICLICGERGLADALLNVFLFVPLGALLLPEVGARRATIAGALLSLAIEALQTAIPGRHPSTADLLFNGTGAALGAYLGPGALGAVRTRVASSRAIVGWVATCVSALGLTGMLLTASVTDDPLYGQWTPDLGWPVYEGRVLQASVHGIGVPPYRIRDEDEEAVRGALLEGSPVNLRFVAGPPPPGTAPVFNVFDGRQQAILSVSVEGTDVIVHRRYLADRLALDRPNLRVREALVGVAAGDTVEIAVAGLEGGGDRVYVNGRAQDIGHAVGRGWSLLLFPDGVPPWVKSAADLAWLLAMGIPVGAIAATGRLRLVSTGVLLVALALVPAVTPLLPTPWFQYGAVVAGVGLGRLLRPFVARLAIAPA